MKLYVGVTDDRWFEFLADAQPDEVNFWRPSGTQSFKVLQPGEPFLFKLHSPRNVIAGGAFFVRHTVLPLSLAWESFGFKNGTNDFIAFRTAIRKYREKKGEHENDPQIGCTILTAPFFFPQEQWIPIPDSFAMNIVAGKSYDTNQPDGAQLWNAVQQRLAALPAGTLDSTMMVGEDAPRYGESFLTHARLGQGAFRVLVTDAYARRCAITGEKTLPVLQAAHIKPYAAAGPHAVSNGLLLRSDLHILFDRGYVTVTADLKVEVSKRIKEEFSNGREYYALHGKMLANVPVDASEKPDRGLVEWHNENVWLG